MIAGPNPNLDPVTADALARTVRRLVRDEAGDRLNEVHTLGGGRIEAPLDLFVEVTESDAWAEADIDEDDLTLTVTRGEEADVLAEPWAEVTDSLDAPPPGQEDPEALARERERIEEEAAATRRAEEEAAAAHAAAQEAPEEEAPEEEPGQDHATAAPPEAVDPTDRARFRNIDALVAFAEEHKIDLTGLRTRGEIEAAITAANPTTTTTA